MAEGYLFFLTTIAFWPMKYLFGILCVVFISQYGHYGKFTALHKLISICLQLTKQIKFPALSCGARAIFIKLLWGWGWISLITPFLLASISFFNLKDFLYLQLVCFYNFFIFFYPSKKICYIFNSCIIYFFF